MKKLLAALLSAGLLVFATGCPSTPTSPRKGDSKKDEPKKDDTKKDAGERDDR